MKLWKLFWKSYHYEMGRYHNLRFSKYYDELIEKNPDKHFMNQFYVMDKFAKVVTRLISRFMW